MELKEKTKAIGNAAGSGACEALLSRKTADAIGRLHKIMEYIELSSNKDFVEAYVNAMGFGSATLP